MRKQKGLFFLNAKKIVISLVVILNFHISAICANTLDDVRKKAGWQPPCYSERDSSYVPLITPVELLAFLDRYKNDVIRMKVLFNGVSTRDLNLWVGPKGNKFRRPSAKYVSFTVNDPKRGAPAKDVILFISKANPDSEKVPNIQYNVPILVTGMVRNTTNGKARIEVSRIDLL